MIEPATASLSEERSRLPRRCACRPDCAELVKTPGARFALGHHARVAERNGKGLLPVRQCSVCGRGPAPLAASVPESAEASAPPFVCNTCLGRKPSQPPERQARCARCRRLFTYASYNKPTYCGPGCAWPVLIPRPKEPFNAYVFDQWCDSGLTLAEYTRGLGLRPRQLDSTLLGKRPRQATVDALRAIYGEALPPVETETERARARAARARQSSPLMHPGTDGARDAYRASAEARRKSPKLHWTLEALEAKEAQGSLTRAEAQRLKVIRKRVATQRANGDYERLGERTRIALQRWEVQARRWLGRWLKNQYGPIEQQRQVRDQVHRRLPELAQQYAEQKGIEVGLVLGAWQLLLDKRGLQKPTGGRRRNEDRHRLVAARMAAWPRKADGDLADGFWPHAWQQVHNVEGKRAPSTPGSLMQWWLDHKAKCPCQYPETA